MADLEKGKKPQQVSELVPSEVQHKVHFRSNIQRGTDGLVDFRHIATTHELELMADFPLEVR